MPKGIDYGRVKSILLDSRHNDSRQSYLDDFLERDADERLAQQVERVAPLRAQHLEHDLRFSKPATPYDDAR